MMKVTATIITLNEELNIRAACQSVDWADEIIVVDSDSTDSTRALATDAGATVFNNPWPGFAAQKQFAVDKASHEWIFSLDADERVSSELRTSISALQGKTESEMADAYLVSRRTFYQGRWIRGGGWYPDRQLRLFRKSMGHWKKRHIHESVTMKTGAQIGTLAGDLLHYTVKDAAYHHRMIGERYAPLAARQMFEEGKRSSTLRVGIAGPSAFMRSFILKGGFRDGFAGLTIANFAAHHAFLKYLLLWELQRKEESMKE
jgi:glycosyltransferase involved in cell wall biosynthesis